MCLKRIGRNLNNFPIASTAEKKRSMEKEGKTRDGESCLITEIKYHVIRDWDKHPA